MDRIDLFRHLSGIVRLATGVPVCTPADDDKPAPTGSYASIEPYSSIGERGQANQRSTVSTDPLNVDMSFSRQLAVRASINFYRDNAKLYAAKLHQGNKRPDVAGLLRDAGIGWSMTNAVNDLDAIAGGKTEQRAQVYLTFWMEITDELTYNALLDAPVGEITYGDTTPETVVN
jgi:hypothetical protein